MRIHHRPYTWVEGHAAQVLEPGDTHTLKTASQRSGEMFSGLVDGEGRAGIRSTITPRAQATSATERGPPSPSHSRRSTRKVQFDAMNAH